MFYRIYTVLKILTLILRRCAWFCVSDFIIIDFQIFWAFKWAVEINSSVYDSSVMTIFSGNFILRRRQDRRRSQQKLFITTCRIKFRIQWDCFGNRMTSRFRMVRKKPNWQKMIILRGQRSTFKLFEITTLTQLFMLYHLA